MLNEVEGNIFAVFIVFTGNILGHHDFFGKGKKLKGCGSTKKVNIARLVILMQSHKVSIELSILTTITIFPHLVIFLPIAINH